jgi:antitoxin component of MazEF toxin-antitoxin module
MKTVECIARVAPDGRLQLPVSTSQELDLKPDMEVKVVVSRLPTEEERSRLAAEAWEMLDRVREELSKKNFNATDALLQARYEEQDRL